MKTLSLLTALSSDTEEQIRTHGQLPCALLIDTRPTPDAGLRMDWRTQYRHDPHRRLDVAWLESEGYQVLLLTAECEKTDVGADSDGSLTGHPNTR